ncbi:MAG: hypothetical protein PHI45_02950 [Candidatus Pacebacteria bacterium]|nr:hypothetical protein [Candidatus Paceibacterota bacterium]MDD5753012.1 hypothetical protein [Candidatus Paceibacterota bacterium]
MLFKSFEINEWLVDCSFYLIKTKRAIWNRRILVWIADFYSRIGNNEFHWLFDLDPYAMIGTTKEQKERYTIKLYEMRKRIHLRTMPVN